MVDFYKINESEQVLVAPDGLYTNAFKEASMSTYPIVCAGCGQSAMVKKKTNRYCSLQCACTHRSKPRRPMKERFNKYVVIEASGCWRWTGTLNKAGYGRLGNPGEGSGTMLAHVFSYEDKHGPVPSGLELDHLCRNTWCCNP